MSQSDFNTMVSQIPSAVANIEYSITKIDEQTDALQLEIDDIKDYTLSTMTSAASGYLITKAAELQMSLGVTTSVCISGNFGLMTQWVSGGPTDNLTDWSITSGGGIPCDDNIVWDASDVTSAPPTSGADYKQWKRQIDYDRALEHIYREFNDELYPPGSENYLPIVTYGIQASKDGLLLGRKVLLKDKAKLQEMYDIYADFVTS